MELILLSDVEKVGRRGDVIKVRDGFARNFLLPRDLALPATRANRQFVEEHRVRAEKRSAKERTEAEAKVKDIEKLKVTIEAPAGEQDKLFGSVTSDDISQALARHGLQIDKKKIGLKESIRSLGSYAVSIEIYSQVRATVTIEVVRKP